MSGLPYGKGDFLVDEHGRRDPWLENAERQRIPLKSSTRRWLSVIALGTAPVLEKAVGSDAFKRWLQAANDAVTEEVQGRGNTAEVLQEILQAVEARRSKMGES